jgi:hypothetical protein
MKRPGRIVVAAVVLTLTLMIPAQAGVPRTVIWRCVVPGEAEPVDFVTAAEAARHGINTANAHAGQVFHLNFGEDCTVL